MPAKRDLYKAKHDFGVMFGGEQITVHTGEVVSSTNDDGARLLKQLGKAGVEEHFEVFTQFGRWDVESASAAPGEKRGS